MRLKFTIASILAIALGGGAAAYSQSFAQPLPLEEGRQPLPAESIRATGFYTYTADKGDRLITVEIPSVDAQIFLSPTAIENPYYSQLPVMTRKFPETDSCRTRFAVKAGETVYLKISFIVWTPTEDAPLTINTDIEEIEFKDGYTLADPIDGNQQKPIYLPLTVGSNDLLKPVYVEYTSDGYGSLRLEFEPSVTQIDIATSADENAFSRLPHTYLYDYGTTIGAKALYELAGPGQHLWLKITGFTPSIIKLTREDPEPGTLCDFPLEAQYGSHQLPFESEGNIYFHIKPEAEGFLQITSPHYLEGGSVEVMMDCNGFGGFLIEGDLNLRAPVWDNMDYTIAISKAADSGIREDFRMEWVAPEPFDSFFEGEEITAGATHTTPSYAGTYYYRIKTPAECESTVKLETATQPRNEKTHAALLDANDGTRVLATGRDFAYCAEAGEELMLKYSVFDTRTLVSFIVDIEEKESGIKPPASTPGGEYRVVAGGVAYKGSITITTPEGKRQQLQSDSERTLRLLPGLYIITTANKTEKTIITK